MLVSKDVQEILEGLKDNVKGPTSISIGAGAEFTTDQFDEICQALAENTRLIQFRCQSCHVNARKAQSLGLALQKNQSLETLDLYGNAIDNQTVKFIIEGIKKNKGLTSLNLFENCIDDEGAKYIAQELKAMNNLELLDLGSNKISPYGQQALLAALDENRNLINLNLEMNPGFTWAITDKMKAKLSKNANKTKEKNIITKKDSDAEIKEICEFQNNGIAMNATSSAESSSVSLSSALNKSMRP